MPLLCDNAPVNPNGTSQLLLTTTLATNVKLKKIPSGPKPKPGRYAFDFASSFTAFTGKIDKVTGAPKPRIPRSQGSLSIDDLDSPPGQWNCSTDGTLGWAGPLPAP